MYFQKGFTIVELLIVVVVIAILAAITVVSYTGIAQRANNSQQLRTLETMQKALLNGVTEGFSVPSKATPICLGKASDYPAADGFAQNICAKVEIAGTTVLVPFDATDFSTWTAGRMPSAKMPVATVSTVISGDNYVYTARGAWLTAGGSYQSGGAVVMNWIPQIKGQCGAGTYVSNAICQQTVSF